MTDPHDPWAWPAATPGTRRQHTDGTWWVFSSGRWEPDDDIGPDMTAADVADRRRWTEARIERDLRDEDRCRDG